MLRRIGKAIAVTVAVLIVTAGSCGGSDSDTLESLLDDVGEPPATSVPVTDGSNDSNDSDDSNGGPAASGDFETVFGIPPFGTARQQPGFGQYSEINNDFQCGKNVFFEMTGAEQDEVVAYYTDTLTNAGYVVTPLQLGESIALNLSMPDNPAINGVVQVGPLSPTDSTLGINHDWSEFKLNPDADNDGSPSSGGSSADDSSDAAN